MQDRFRFRAWSFETGVMHYDAECAYDGVCGTPNIDAGSFDGLLEDDEYVVMQCTGLKDKNGRLVYEGDIVKIIHTTPYGEVIEKVRIVEYSHCCFWARTSFTSVLLYDEKNEYEVLGNIYENKELLK